MAYSHDPGLVSIRWLTPVVFAFQKSGTCLFRAAWFISGSTIYFKNVKVRVRLEARARYIKMQHKDFMPMLAWSETNQSVYYQSIYNRSIYNQSFYSQCIYNRSMHNRFIYNRFIYNQCIYNQSITSLFITSISILGSILGPRPVLAWPSNPLAVFVAVSNIFVFRLRAFFGIADGMCSAGACMCRHSQRPPWREPSNGAWLVLDACSCTRLCTCLQACV